jgi:hypothetical protein
MNVYFPVGSRTSCSPLFSPVPWVLPFGPLRNRMFPPSGRVSLIQFAQFRPSFSASSAMYFV